MEGSRSTEAITWRKPRRSEDQGGACLEVARLPEAIAVRDSKRPDGARLVLGQAEFRMFLARLKK
ncbi:DUF397 domain-containing protein [Actinomadura sp. 9N407]|uniref:DUF397 domain-containing protein n=1 Tax=Actinomadura sp. 9N407 TaxID=3375154 RepID=UPI0037988E8F